jgi:hypothetical protein
MRGSTGPGNQSDRGGERRGLLLAATGGLTAAGAVGWLVATRGGGLASAFAACPPWALAGATLAHALTLVLRSEAWRLALNAVERNPVPRRHIHAANAGAFLAGCLQSHAAMPVRIALLRRLAPDRAPRALQIVLADAPIFLIEACLAATLLILAAGAGPGLPWWAAPSLLGAGIAALVALRGAHVRLGDRTVAAGLAVLADRRRRAALTGVVAALTALALVRVWIVLAAFDLEAGLAEIALVFFSLGAIGLLPLGMGTGPAAAVGGAGTSAGTLVPAAAAGLAISATTLLAVLAYALACWLLTLAVRAASRARAAGAAAPEAEVIPFPSPPLAPPRDAELAA